MKIQYASDLHLEFYSKKYSNPEFFEMLVKPTEGVNMLILAGDIGYPEEDITKEFITWCCNKWPHVVWIFGNHEYYYKPEKVLMMTEKEWISMNYTPGLPNLHVLHNSVLQLKEFPSIRIVGTTLWTYIPEDSKRLVAKYMNDCRQILTNSFKALSVEEWNEMYTQNCEFLKREFEYAARDCVKLVVVSHHLPSFKCILPEYQGSDLNCAFASNADELIENPLIAAWICGHSHGQQDLTMKNREGQDVLVSFNARGYPRESSIYTYDSSKILLV